VLGGGGITGAAFHFGALISLRMATEWNPADADVVVGTSSGAVLAALVRSDRLSLDALIGDVHGANELAWELRTRIYRRTRPGGVGRWMRHGLLPGIRRPGLGLAVGSPARYTTDGIADWIRETIGEAAGHWPDAPTTIVAYEWRDAAVPPSAPKQPRRRSGDGGAASAVPSFEPVEIDGRHYVDGVASGTTPICFSAPRTARPVIVGPMAPRGTPEPASTRTTSADSVAPPWMTNCNESAPCGPMWMSSCCGRTRRCSPPADPIHSTPLRPCPAF
jgi:NTE family protein